MEKKELEKLVEKLQADVRTYREAGAEIGNEIRTLKLRLAGSKGLNKQLQSKVEHYKDLCLEGDKLNEARIAAIEKLEKECEAYKTQIQNLQSSLKTAMYDLNVEKSNFEAYRNWPWYKKIFTRW